MVHCGWIRMAPEWGRLTFVLSCHAFCLVIPTLVLSCHVMSCHFMSCHFMSCHVSSCHILPCHVSSCHVLSYHAVPCLVMSCLIMSCLVLSCHVLSILVWRPALCLKCIVGFVTTFSDTFTSNTSLRLHTRVPLHSVQKPGSHNCVPHSENKKG